MFMCKYVRRQRCIYEVANGLPPRNALRANSAPFCLFPQSCDTVTVANGDANAYLAFVYPQFVMKLCKLYIDKEKRTLWRAQRA